jgi:hypothetical protein
MSVNPLNQTMSAFHALLIDDTASLRSRIQLSCRHSLRLLLRGREDGWLVKASFPRLSAEVSRASLTEYVESYCALEAPRASVQTKREMVKKLERLYEAIERKSVPCMLTELEACIKILFKIDQGPEWTCAHIERWARRPSTTVEDMCRMQSLAQELSRMVMQQWPANGTKED